MAPVVPDTPAWFSQMAILPLPPCDTATLYRRLNAEYDIEVPVGRWNGMHTARLSVQGYNSRDDIDRLIGALADLLPQVAT
jgi:isopenicillin-N epimerase